MGTYFKEGGVTEAPVDVSRVKRFMERVNKAWEKVRVSEAATMRRRWGTYRSP